MEKLILEIQNLLELAKKGDDFEKDWVRSHLKNGETYPVNTSRQSFVGEVLKELKNLGM